jgi:dihydrofolate reductase
MGRKTLESFPNKMPLPKRTNIVLTKNKDYNAHGAIVVGNKEELLEELAEYDSDEIYIIGGESIYNMMLPYCDTAYVTKLDYTYDADTFFPNLDQMEDWEIVEESEEQTFFDIEFTFRTYKRK